MDDFGFWTGLVWDVLVAWFGTWPVWMQAATLLVLAAVALYLAWMAVWGIWRVVLWLRGLRRPRLTLVEAQGSATIISIEAYLRRMRRVREMPEEGA